MYKIELTVAKGQNNNSDYQLLQIAKNKIVNYLIRTILNRQKKI